MPPKGKKGAPSAQRSRSGEDEREEPLQAVVLADSFETRFHPFTLEKPRCLLLLANTPLIEYTLEFLANAGVEDVFVYCGNHTDAIEDYLKHSKWTGRASPFSLEVIRSTSRSIGDAMRDLDQKDLITGDFICVYGDVIANVPLERALAAHRARREKDKKCIMTMVLREAGDVHRTKSQSVRPCFVVDTSSQRCVHYEQVRLGQQAGLQISDEVLNENIEVEVRQDLIDCGIDICTPEVLAQWSDNFDWQMPRKGFLNGVLKDYETMQYKIYTHIMAEGYAARVKNLHAYAAITKDIISRWTYPLCPDVNLLPDQSYQLTKGCTYKEEGVVLARSSRVNHKVVLGRATSVGEGTVITNSVIGRRCVIGKRVRIRDAYIWDDARIGDDTTIDKAIVANEASIGKQCHLSNGVLISYGVSVAGGTTISDNKRITRRRKDQASGELLPGSTDTQVVGEGGHGFELQLDEEEEDAVDIPLTGIGDVDPAIDDNASISTLESDDGGIYGHVRSERTGSFASVGSDESGEARGRSTDFYHEAVNSVFDAIQKSVDPDTINVELRSLRMASNVEDKYVRRAVAVAFTKRIANLMETGSSPKDAVAATIPPNQLLVKACVSETSKDKEAEAEQAEFMLFLQNDLLHRPQGEKVLLFASNSLATNDLIEPEGFEMWWNDPRSSATDDLQKVRAETKQLVEVLVGDDDESEEDEDEDEDDDE